MKLALVTITLVCACGKSAPPTPTLSIAADLTGEATLVAGTRRFALYSSEMWWQSDTDDQPAISAVVARESDRLGGLVDVFLGTTPIVAGGEEHHEAVLRVTPSVTPIEFDGTPTKIVTMRDGREAWLAHVGIVDEVVFVDGTHVEEAPKLALMGPPADTVSPVSARLCATPKVEDIAAGAGEVHALVSECNDDAPMRIVSYPSGRVAMLPSRKGLAMRFMKLVVSHDGKAHLAGISDGRFQIENVVDNMGFNRSLLMAMLATTRVETAVAADDGAIWTFVLDGDGKPQVLRNGTIVVFIGAPRALALDDKLGVVVLTGNSLLAERPGARIVIGPHR